MESINVSSEDLGKLKRKLSITIPKENVIAAYKKCYNALKSKVNIPGFRKGQVPQSIIEKRYDKAMQQDTLEVLIPEFFDKALKQENLEPIGRPQFADLDIKNKEPLTFSAAFEIGPEFDLPASDSYKLEKKEVEITKEDVDKQREYHMNRSSKFETTEEPVGDSDQVSFDSRSDPENENIESKNDYSYNMDAGYLELEYIEALKGMITGEEKTFEISYPEDYRDKNLQGVTSKIILTVKEVKKKVLPELNEAFYKQFNESKNEEDFEKYLDGEVKELKNYENKAEYRKELRSQLENLLTFELPEQILTEEVNYRVKQQKEQNKDEAVTDEMLKEKAEKEATDNLRFSFFVQQLLDKEELKVDENEVGRRFQMNCMMMGMDPNELVKQEYGKQLYQQTHGVIAEETVLDFVTDKIIK
ncbi:MAG: trigger factor [Deltaproteobacteria bacterium]|jgi:trigger factor|nr:trigger factor [Deltaproteobacteria bacterium]MBT4526317.1 trigger factor [Deltaproteobacteria bacterium]